MEMDFGTLCAGTPNSPGFQSSFQDASDSGQPDVGNAGLFSRVPSGQKRHRPARIRNLEFRNFPRLALPVTGDYLAP